VLVERAVRLLDVQRGERVIDWFCGLGNFTLPLATRAGEVLGIEGSEALVARSRENVARNEAGRAQPLAATRFLARNLFEITPQQLMADGAADRWLVDPPREGAFALAKALADLHQNHALREGGWTRRGTVYVSCNPATLARDAGLLVHGAGYTCRAAAWSACFRTRAWSPSRSSSEHEKGPEALFVAQQARQSSPEVIPRITSGALEDVEQVQVQRPRGADVVSLAAVDDLLQVVQHVQAEDADRRVLITSTPTVEPMNTLMTAPTTMTRAPANSHLPMPERSRLMKVASVAMTKNTAAVPPKAVITTPVPFFMPSTMASSRDSIRPMKKVNASSTPTPAAESLVFWMAYMKAKAPPRKTIRPSPPFAGDRWTRQSRHPARWEPGSRAASQ
jgi:mRNA-degrading endonuclease toxin of MazEF toxin-antitoxin module